MSIIARLDPLNVRGWIPWYLVILPRSPEEYRAGCLHLAKLFVVLSAIGVPFSALIGLSFTPLRGFLSGSFVCLLLLLASVSFIRMRNSSRLDLPAMALLWCWPLIGLAVHLLEIFGLVQFLQPDPAKLIGDAVFVLIFVRFAFRGWTLWSIQSKEVLP